MTSPSIRSQPGLRPVERALELLLERGVPATFVVVSDSMLPRRPPESNILVAPGRAGLRRGDVLVFRQADYFAVHRLLGRAGGADGRRGFLRTRGDAARSLDAPLDPERVAGRVVAVRRGDAKWRAM